MTLGSTPDVTPYDTNEATPKARLLVTEGESYVRVPLLNDGVTTHVRKGGPLDINRVTDVYVPREWQDVDFGQFIDVFDPATRSVYDRAEVQLYDDVSETYVTVHNGFVTGFGGVGSTKVDGCRASRHSASSATVRPRCVSRCDCRVGDLP